MYMPREPHFIFINYNTIINLFQIFSQFYFKHFFLILVKYKILYFHFIESYLKKKKNKTTTKTFGLC